MPKGTEEHYKTFSTANLHNEIRNCRLPDTKPGLYLFGRDDWQHIVSLAVIICAENDTQEACSCVQELRKRCYVRHNLKNRKRLRDYENKKHVICLIILAVCKGTTIRKAHFLVNFMFRIFHNRSVSQHSSVHSSSSNVSTSSTLLPQDLRLSVDKCISF